MDPVVIVVQPVTLAVAVPAVPAPTVTLGAQGPMGPAGPARGNFDFTQGTASDTWTIAHNLGYYPSVTVVDSLGREVEGDVHYLDTNNITIYFTAALAGQAFLN